MREFIRPFAVALSVACLAGSTAIVSSGDALAQFVVVPFVCAFGKPRRTKGNASRIPFESLAIVLR